MKCSLLPLTFPVLKCTLVFTNIATPAFLLLMSSRYNFFFSLNLSLFVSFWHLLQTTYNWLLFLEIQLGNICFLIGGYRSFSFIVIINKVWFKSAALLLIFCSFFAAFFFSPFSFYYSSVFLCSTLSPLLNFNYIV